MRPPNTPSRELQDAVSLGVVVVCTLVTWVVFLGWAPRLMLAGNDALTLWVPMLRMVGDHAAEAAPGGYEWAVLGGTKVREVLGVTWLQDLGARAGLSPTTVINLMVLHTQVGIAFFAVRGGCALIDDGKAPAAPPVVLTVIITWLSAFAPVVGWRVEAGHLNLLMGSAAIMATFYVLLTSLRGTLSMVGLALAWLAMVTALQTCAHPLLFPSALFLGPLALVLLLPTTGHAPRHALLMTLLVLGSALLASAGAFAEFLAYSMSQDAARRPGAASVAHMYHVAHGQEWWGSLWWALGFAAPRADRAHQHETNLPLGPVIWLALWGASRRSRSAALALGAAALGVVLFASQVEPFSSWLLQAVPLMGAFRLPARTLLPVALVAVIFVVPAIASVLPRWTLRNALTAVAPLLLLLLPGSVREVASWMAAALVLPWALKLPGQLRAASAVILATASLAAFSERHPNLPDVETGLASVEQLAERLTAENPSLRNPLFRIHLRQFHKLFSVSTGMASGLSTMTAVSHGGRRFTSLFTALYGFPEEPTFTLFLQEDGTPAFDVMAALYNVSLTQQPQPDGTVRTVARPTPGPAWFPARVETQDGIPALATRLLAAHATAADLLKETLFLTRDDAESVLPPNALPCPNAQVVDTRYDAPVVQLTLAGVEGLCPVVVAANHAETLIATSVRADGSTQQLRTFVADGTLLGVLVPPGTTRVDLVSPRFHLAMAPVLEGAALLVLAVAMWMVRKTLNGRRT